MEFVLQVYNSNEFDASPADYVKVELNQKDVEFILKLRNAVKQANAFMIQEFDDLPTPCSRDYDDPADTDENPVVKELSLVDFSPECMMIGVTQQHVEWTFYQKHGTSLHTTESISIDELLDKVRNGKDSTNQERALLPDTENTDYILSENFQSAWVTVDDISVYIRRTDEGVVVDLYPHGSENNDPLGSTYAFFSDAKSFKKE